MYFSLGVKHVHGGQTKVLGIHDHFSGFNWVRLLRNETADELIIAWREYLNFCGMHKVVWCVDLTRTMLSLMLVIR